MDPLGRPDLPWLWEVVPGYFASKGYRWLQRNVVMRNDETGVTIRYRPRRPDDAICGARTIHPEHPAGVDCADPGHGQELVCTIPADWHAELPHVGVPAACADMTCTCRTVHLVIVGVAITRPMAEAHRGH